VTIANYEAPRYDIFCLLSLALLCLNILLSTLFVNTPPPPPLYAKSESPSLHPCETKLLTPVSRVILEKPIVPQIVKDSPPFMKTEGSLPYSQEPATGPCHEPNESSPHPPTDFFKIHFSVVLPSTSRSFLVVSSFQALQQEFCMHF
jgi:hypothetical protein